MKKTNVIVKNANLNILKGIENTLTIVEKTYLGNDAPCVVFEDANGVVYFVARTKEEYFKNINLVPPTLDENKAEKLKELNIYINNMKKSFEAPYDDISLASFTDKRKDYFSSLSNGATPTVDLLSTNSAGVLDTTKRDALLVAIGNKVKLVLSLETYGDDTRTAIKACNTQSELDAIVI